MSEVETPDQLVRKLDRSKWGKGEWDNEVDRVDFIHAGFSCFILRNAIGNWCGYVGVPSTHSAYGKYYDEVDVVDVHGGLTYADKCSPPICHIPNPGMPHDVWWLGFDTSHSGDLVPSMSLSGYMGSYGTYKTQDYTLNETKGLAEQLSRI
jgi:hypothetical protein